MLAARDSASRMPELVGGLSAAAVGEAKVPATLQATIGARVDRLDPKAKRRLSAAALIISGLSLNLLETLAIDPVLEHLVASELIDQIRFTGQPEFMFHHPLISNRWALTVRARSCNSIPRNGFHVSSCPARCGRFRPIPGYI